MLYQVIMIAIKRDHRDSSAAARSDTPPSDESGFARMEEESFYLMFMISRRRAKKCLGARCFVKKSAMLSAVFT